jgi:uncharacterized repeat protein (TIGR01451 family)
MNFHFAPLLCLLTGVLALVPIQSNAQLHRATRLGNPATRFAPPLFTVEDLRSRFRDEKLRPDFIAVLDQWGWQGDPADMFRAAASNEVTEVKILVGERMPFMSTRENGKPICLRDVMWAGKEPAPAFAFNFSSKGRRYRCVTPKACSNFFLEDLGPEPRPTLSLICNAPEEIATGRAVGVCMTIINSGTASSESVRLSLPIPAGARVTSRTDRAVVETNRIVWEIAALAPNQGKQVCAVFKSSQPGVLDFNPAATSGKTNSFQSSCSTRVIGIPAILLEVVDLDDPIEVGNEVTYEIKVTNQGTAVGTNVRLVCIPPASQQFVSATGTTSAHSTNGVITMDSISQLAPKASAIWRVNLKATVSDDARFKIELSSDQFERPITEDESTQQY